MKERGELWEAFKGEIHFTLTMKLAKGRQTMYRQPFHGVFWDSHDRTGILSVVLENKDKSVVGSF